MEKKLLFSLTKKDFEIQTFRCGGKGGQNVNKVETGVRIIHHASGAIGEGREYRTQGENKKSAFRKLVASGKFKIWHYHEVARRLGQEKNVEETIDDMMRPENLKVEVKENDRWVNECTTNEQHG